MLKRILTGVIGAIIFIPVLYFSGTFVFSIAIAILTVVSVLEMLHCIGVIKKYALTIPICVLGAALPFAVRYLPVFGVIDVSFVLISATVLLLIYLLTLSLLSHGFFTIDTVASVFMSIVYVIGGYIAILIVRDFVSADIDTGTGKYLYLIIFIAAWSTDIFAYFCGKFFGKHKLIPDVSPKKTVAGSIGGIVFCTLFCVLYGLTLQSLRNVDVTANLIVLGVIGIVLSVVSQIGDLTLSHIKRRYGIKDFGKILPGHGGFLDRFDSIISVAMVMAVACYVIKYFGGHILI